MNRQYSIAEAKTHFSKIVHAAEKGRPIELTRRGRRVAVLISSDEFDKRGKSVGSNFCESYQRFLIDIGGREHLLSDEEYRQAFENIRDKSPGREVAF